MSQPQTAKFKNLNLLVFPYARNARTHSEAQIAQIAGSIREFGFTNPVLIDPEGRNHCRSRAQCAGLAGRLPPSRKGTRWDRVLLLLATYRLSRISRDRKSCCRPGTEFPPTT